MYYFFVIFYYLPSTLIHVYPFVHKGTQRLIYIPAKLIESNIEYRASTIELQKKEQTKIIAKK